MAKITINTDALKPQKNWIRHKVNAGDNVYRILPPYGDVDVHQNVPFKKWSVVWGLVDPTSGRMRPINSPMNSDERRCPVTEYLDLLDKQVKSLNDQYKAQGCTEDQIKESLTVVNRLLWEIKPKHGYAYNGVDKSGSVGILEIKTTAHKAMKKRMMEYINMYSQDPTSLSSDMDDSGIWFNITREGERKDTKYDVLFNTTREKDAQGRLVSIDDRSALVANVVENYEDLGYDLHSLYKTPTYDELKATLILNINEWAKENPEVLIPGFQMSDLPQAATAPIETPIETPAPIVQGKKPINISMGTEEDSTATILPTISAPTPIITTTPTTQPTMQQPTMQQPTPAPTPTPTPTSTPTPTPTPTVTPTPTMDDDDFMKMAQGILDS